MADPDVVIDVSIEGTPADVEMGGAATAQHENGTSAPFTSAVERREEEEEAEGVGEGYDQDGMGARSGSGIEDIEPEVPKRITFADHLKSPVIELVVGEGGDATTLYAHERLLIQSPYFEGAVAELAGQSRRITLPQEDLDAVASFLEFLYKADYFPTLSGAQSLEEDPSTPFPDTTGVALLRHARIYTLARRFGLPSLAALAHRKIHLTQSTARGEIAYARYVYANTSPEDESIRKPVAAFWATRSHVLRHEAEREFRTMCLDFPQFGFDVLSLVLDAQEKRTARSEASQVVGSRKRARVSNA